MPPLKLDTDESFGKRLARFRKDRGFTQQALADHVGVLQSIVADYERDHLRLNAEMICRFALALQVSSDELLGLKRAASEAVAKKRGGLSLKLVRRIQRIELLPGPKQKVLLQTIDGYLKGAGISGSTGGSSDESAA